MHGVTHIGGKKGASHGTIVRFGQHYMECSVYIPARHRGGLKQNIEDERCTGINLLQNVPLRMERRRVFENCHTIARTSTSTKLLLFERTYQDESTLNSTWNSDTACC